MASIIDTVEDITSRYPDRYQQLICYRTVRPHLGMWLSADECLHTVQKDTIEQYNSTGIDALIVITRLLISFGYPMTVASPSPAEKALLEVAAKNLGWDKEDDWKLKRYLVDKLSCGQDITCFQSYTFHELITSKTPVQLSNIIEKHSQFELYNLEVVFESDDQGQSWKESQAPPSRDNMILWDGEHPLEKWIWDGFRSQGDGVEYQYTCHRPEFLLVDFLQSRAIPFSDLQSFNIRAPEARKENETWLRGTYTSAYQLIAIIRDDNSKFRVYSMSGKEQPPSEVGYFIEKEPAEETWSVCEPGEYILLYVRIDEPEEPEQGTQERSDPVQGVEYMPRKWRLRRVQPVDEGIEAAQI